VQKHHLCTVDAFCQSLGDAATKKEHIEAAGLASKLAQTIDYRRRRWFIIAVRYMQWCESALAVTSPLLEPVFFALIEQIGLRTPEINNLWASVSLQQSRFEAVISVLPRHEQTLSRRFT
jgi:hypothetical protein